MTSLFSLPLDNLDMTAATSTVSSSPTASLPMSSSSPSLLQQPKQHQHHQQPGCNLMPSWLQQNDSMVHVARKVNDALQCCHSGSDYEEEDLCMAETTDGFDHTIQTMDHRDDVSDGAVKKVCDANINDCIPKKNTEERANEGTNASTAQPSKKYNNGSWLERRQEYRMLGKQARKRRYCRPQSKGTIPLTNAMEEGDCKNDN